MMSDTMYDEVGIVDGVYVRGDWKKIAIHNETCIKGFFGPYRFLSNMSASIVRLDGVSFPSVENAYQAAKFLPRERTYFEHCSPYEAKLLTRYAKKRFSSLEWDSMKVSCMQDLLLQKFDHTMNPELSALLRATGECFLEETNWWKDTFWGCTPDGEGENVLGKLLMSIRNSL
jgi:ribA/ribD-fused uncharacterized protein